MTSDCWRTWWLGTRRSPSTCILFAANTTQNVSHFYGTVIGMLGLVGNHGRLAKHFRNVLPTLRGALDRLKLVRRCVVKNVLLRHFAVGRIVLVPHHQDLRLRTVLQEAANPTVHVRRRRGVRYIIHNKSHDRFPQEEAGHRPVLLFSRRIPNVKSIREEHEESALHLHFLPILALQNDVLRGERRSDSQAVCRGETVLGESLHDASADFHENNTNLDLPTARSPISTIL